MWTAGMQQYMKSIDKLAATNTETEEDVQMSISLMKKLIKINPHIVFGFAITTPFPGSPLHEQLLADGIFKDENDFYEKYHASCGGGLRLVANGSAMSDETVIKLSKKIAKICLKEKRKELGLVIYVVELIKRSISRLNRLFCNKVLKIHQYFRSDDKGFFIMLYRKLFDSTILFLEGISLKSRKLN